jgi:putative spermidine/putrescine transport system substrate-binding protein
VVGTQLARLAEQSQLGRRREQICARLGEQLRLIPLDDVYYFMAGQKYVTVRHRGGSDLIDGPLRSLSIEFAPDFLRVHRNALVAIRSVSALERDPEGRYLVRLRDCEDTLPVSRRHAAETLRLIRGGEVAAVNLSLIPNYANVFEGLKNQPHNTVDGVSYGVPHGRGANVLAWNTDELGDSLDSWSIVFDPNSPAKGKLSLYGSPIYIADAAVYLMATQPDLKITDPYSLDETQFKAAVDLLKSVRPNVGEFWADATKQINSFAGGNVWAGTTWQYQVNTLVANDPPAPIKAVLPKEGSTGWSDTWMISSKAQHPNCMYKWMDYIISPVPNANATVYFGEAPVSKEGCAEAEKLSPGHCETFHAEDEAYFDKVYYWNTPSKTCIDGRGDICTDYNEWTKAWTEIQG